MNQQRVRSINKVQNKFTLIELLLTISILMILATLISPSLRKMVNKASQSHCIANLKTVGVGVHLYHEDYDGMLPMARSPINGDPYRNGFVGELAPYLNYAQEGWLQQYGCYRYSDAPDVLSCVSETYSDKNILGYGWNWKNLGAYYDGSYRTWGERKNINEIKSPRYQAMVGESQPIGRLDTTLWWGGKYFRAPTEMYIGARHNKISNYLLVDGHVEFDFFDQLVLNDTLFTGEK